MKRKIGVIGGGRSGLACVQAAQKIGDDVFLSELRPESVLGDVPAMLQRLGIPFETGGHTVAVLEGMDYVVISPGIPPNIPIIAEAERRNIPVISEIEYIYRQVKLPIVAVTGSNGKTTVVTLIGKILADYGFAPFIGGNIGNPFSRILLTNEEYRCVVLELSSFQLERIDQFHPVVAVMLNLTPDHQDRYSDLASYYAAKCRIWKNQGPDDYTVLNADDPETIRHARGSAKGNWLLFSTAGTVADGAFAAEGNICRVAQGQAEDVVAFKECRLRGPHNLSNMAAAVAAVLPLQVGLRSLAETLRTFQPVEHRLEPAGMVNGRLFINDSKATNVDALNYALRSFDEKLVLLAGGYDKGGDFTVLRDLVAERCAALVAFGKAREKVLEQLGGLVPTYDATAFADAVNLAYQKSEPGQVILLAPGCASYDEFDNYEHRGRVFKEIVARLKETHESK